MIHYLLDTNICIEILRGNRSVRAKLAKANPKECAISEITVLELMIGEELAKKKSPQKYIDQHLDAFIKAIRVLPISDSFGLVAKEKTRLQLAGTPVENNFDLLIGCTAVVNGLTMVTDNTKDFKRINNIRLENWLER